MVTHKCITLRPLLDALLSSVSRTRPHLWLLALNPDLLRWLAASSMILLVMVVLVRVGAVNVVDGELLHINKVSRLHMTAYLCVASNGVPPSISKRVQLRVQCK